MKSIQKLFEPQGGADAEKKPDGYGARDGVLPIAVCTVGAVLTLYTFVLASVFTSNTLGMEYDNVSNRTVEALSEGIGELKDSIRILSGFLASQPRQKISVGKKLLHSLPRLHGFDLIVWVRPGGGGWQEQIIYKKEEEVGGREMIALTPAFYAALEKSDIFAGEDIYFLSALPGLNQKRLDGLAYGILYKPFLVAGAVEAGNPAAGVVMGLTRLDEILDAAWLSDTPNLLRARVSDLKSSELLFEVQSYAEDTSTPMRQTYEIDTGRERWEVSVAFFKNKRLFLLENIAPLVLLLGAALTAAATFYVRNHVAKSREMVRIYAEIESKNIDLEQGVKQKQDIFDALRKSERENRAIIDSVNDIIFEIAADGIILFLSGAWNRVTGFPVSQSLGTDLFSLLKSEDQNTYRKDFQLLVQGQKEPYRSFTKLRTSQGSFRAVELAYTMIRTDEDGQVRVVGTFTDIEERRKAERALSIAEQKYRAIVENAPAGIYQLTPEGLYLSANIALARILGYDGPEDILYTVKNANQNIYVSARERLNFIRRLEETDGVASYEAQAFRKNGTKIWISESARIVRDDNGNILYYEGSIEDITERKKQEEMLRQAKLNSDMVNRAKTEFLQNMSHELRTPLNSIIGFAELIKNEAYGPIARREYVEHANDIYESGHSFLKIITEILDISRIEAGERELKESAVNIAKVATTCLTLFNAKIEAGQMDVTNMLHGIPLVRGEELAIKQVMTNLISNAVKFTPSGGRLTLSYEVDKGGRLRVSFTDTGIGLDEEEIHKALSPFGQVDSELSKSGSGAGLGLTLVQSLMDLHGGSLEMFSQKGIGTTATIVFPVDRVLVAADAEKV